MPHLYIFIFLLRKVTSPSSTYLELWQASSSFTPGQREYPALSSNISVISTPHPQSTILGIFSTVLIFESFTCFTCCTDVVSSTGFTRFIGKGVQETVIFLRGLQKRVLEISGTAY
jgi:hypothetical protein